jgi:low affinity Fe/Cu permease
MARLFGFTMVNARRMLCSEVGAALIGSPVTVVLAAIPVFVWLGLRAAPNVS